MIIHNFIIIYTYLLLVISQIPILSKITIFLTLPFMLFLILRHPKISTFSLKKLLPFIILILIALFMGLSKINDIEMYYFGRDIMYYFQPLVFIVTGIYLFIEIRDYKKILKILIFSSSIVTLYFLLDLIKNPEILLESSLKIRYEYQISNFSSITTILLLHYSRNLYDQLFNKYIYMFLLFISYLSLVLSFSRTNYLILLIILLFYIFKRKKIIWSMYISAIFIVFIVLFGSNFKNIKEGNQGTTFLAKLTNSFNEIYVQDYYTKEDIIQNWRGYEAFLGLSDYEKGNTLEIFFGQGLGAFSEGPLWVFGGEQFQVIPIFHNGYITILLKSGIVGLLLFFIFLVRLLNVGLNNMPKDKKSELHVAMKFLRVIVFIILFNTLYVNGLINGVPDVLQLVLLGSTLHYIGIQQIMSKGKKYEKIP